MNHTAFFEPEHRALAAELDRFARSEVEPRSAEEADDTAQALDFIQRLARGGWLRYVVPRSFGGVHPHLDLRSVCLIRRGLARYSSLADTMFAMQGLGSYPITLAGSEKIKQRFLPQVASGEAIATFALTEPEAGSDAAGIQTRARREGNEYVLEGTKKFISNAGIADFYVVFAKTDPAQGRKGISAIVVEKDRPGFHMTRKLELIAPHPIGEFQLEGCRVPAENLLGREGEGYSILLQTLESFRTTVGAAALGLAERALEEATSYAKKRKQFGKTLSEFQGLRFMLAEMATELEAARLLVFQAAWNLDQARREAEAGADSTSTETGDRAPTRTSHRTLVLASSMAKLFATETGQKVIDRALQIHGGTGLLKGTVVERLYREIRALRIYEGTSEIQKEIISRQLLKGADG
ncbi:MAG: acyl-CoA dehydrogenase family protein [Acidobacteria bacterium]|nr:acyl-CoA dehydrogenase family protein [Acidobacteriota bacterium]